ncbi:hypothetical protein M407DRAFT_9259 [Tulasnella calospora MUT 4182]|uniref:Uncharacterized protein n=1 Tax=Tulasnella calospora MUT 4182 TaxID=1051891 RepID=A0A0C3Q4C4_9AGAM|nr:hypothetical protein M407DRAFT_9259 [Tulasnella calospora MUT 4182]
MFLCWAGIAAPPVDLHMRIASQNKRHINHYHHHLLLLLPTLHPRSLKPLYIKHIRIDNANQKESRGDPRTHTHSDTQSHWKNPVPAGGPRHIEPQETDNQWVCFSKTDYDLIDKDIVGLKLKGWSWRKVGTDERDTEELGRFQAAFLEEGKSTEDLLELCQDEDDTAANNEDAELKTVLSPRPEFDSTALAHSPLMVAGSISNTQDFYNINGTDLDQLEDSGPPPRTRRKIDSDQAPTTDTRTPRNLASSELPPEIYVMIFELSLAPLRLNPLKYNTQVEKMRQVCKHWRDVIDQAKRFWLRITSRCPIKINKEAIRKSGRDRVHGLPFSIEFVTGPCDSEVTSAKRLREFSEFMKVVKPYRSRWRSLDIALPEDGWYRLEPYITLHAGHLKTLTVSLTAGYEQQGGLGKNPNHREIRLLGGDGAKLELEHLGLHRLPVHCDPTKLPNLLTLQLSGGIRISTQQLKSFLTNASHLKTLELTDVDSSSGPFDSNWEDPITLSSLRRLTLREMENPINMLSLFLTLHTPNCRHLLLALALDQEAFPNDFNVSMDNLEIRLGTIAQIATESESEVISSIRLGEEGEGHEWGREGVDFQGQPVGVRAMLRFANENDIDPESEDITTIFFHFVQRVLDRSGQTLDTKVDVSNSLRGVGPMLQSNTLEGLNLVELTANILDGYLGCIADFLTRSGSDCKYSSLRTLHLISTQSTQAEEKLRGKSQSLQTFIEHLLISGYAATNEQSVTIILRGRFVMSDVLWEALKDKGQFKEISVDYSRARVWAEDGRVLYLKQGSAVGILEAPSCIDRPW